MLKAFTSVLSGCVAGIAVLFLTEMISHAIYPPPPGLDPSNPENLKALMAMAPTGALVLVLIAGFAGGFAGGIVASLFDRGKKLRRALGVGIVLTILGIINLIMIPHPMWFMIINVVVYICGALAGTMLVKPTKNA